MVQESLLQNLKDSTRPVFLFGSTPPREGTDVVKAQESCAKFAARFSVLATDGFIVYDIQDEAARTSVERPFPFRKTMDPSLYASFFPMCAGKGCIVYKCVADNSPEDFDNWVDTACTTYNHNAFVLVGAASSSSKPKITMSEACKRTKARGDCSFGSVCIPERHMSKGKENVIMLHKVQNGSEWFITQGIFSAEGVIKTILDYGDTCRIVGITPKKVVLTFAPCGRPKTMTFIKWLGMNVPEEVEERIFAADCPVKESLVILQEILVKILEATHNSGVPLGLNVESLSIFKEEINASAELFQLLQATLLNHRGSPWTVKWYYVRMSPVGSASLSPREPDAVFVKANGSINTSGLLTNGADNKAKSDSKQESDTRAGGGLGLIPAALGALALGYFLGCAAARKN
jgi:hypothetical protein